MSSPPAASDATVPVRSLWLAPLLVFALALLVTALLLVSVTRSIEAKDRASFDAEVARTAAAVRERVDTTVALLHGVAGLFQASEHVSREQFRAYVGELRLRERYPGIQGIGYSARFGAQELDQRIDELRAAGLTGFEVWPADPRPEFHTIVYLEPLDERNVAALGYDMFTDPVRRAAMERARDEGAAAASGKVILKQEIDERKQAGLLIYLPLYRGHDVPASVEARRRELAGFVYAPLRAGDLLAGVRGTGVREVDFELFDGPVADPATLLRSTRAPGAPPPQFVATQRLEVAGRTWLLRFGSRPAFESLSQWRLVPWLAAASLAAAVLLAWITFVQARARRDAETAAAQRRRNELALQESEERARERAERLQALYAQQREEARRKDEFLAVLAHELRNPLAPIRNSLEVLGRVPEGPRAARAREVAQRQVSLMVRLIDDLLDVSRISRGKIVLQREPTPLASVVATAVETSRPLIDAKDHRLRIGAIPPDLVLDVDPARLAQVFTNLLNNAANYTPAGGEIDVGVAAGDDEVRVAVRDNGIGIAPDQLQRVFEMFTLAQSTPAGGGLGIGLSLASRLAELHGGRIEAHSEGPGRGAEFVVVLPRRAPAGDPADPPRTGDEPASADAS